LSHLVPPFNAAAPAAAFLGPAGEAYAARAAYTAEAAPMQALTRAWSLLMKGLGETQAAPDPSAAAEIAIIRLAYAADLPTPDEALRAWRDGAGPRASSPSAKPSAAPPSAPNAAPAPPSPPVASAFDEPRVDASDAPQPLPQPQPQPQQPRAASAKRRLRAFEDVARLAGAERDARLRVELETHARLVSFEQGRIELRLDDAAPSDLAGRLVRRLKEWTGETWAVTVNSAADGAPTLREARRARAMADPLVKAAFELFPTAELIAVHEDEPAEGDGDEEAPARRDQSGASA
ncbi:MAG: DNA polymerase III subunit gamma/tau, partial [Parvularculaceae bacterium]